MPRYSVAIVHFRRSAELERCLASLAAQTLGPGAVAIVDHDPEPGASQGLRSRFPGVHWLPGPNRGFAAGANRALREAALRDPAAPFLLLLNDDVELEPGFAEVLVREMQARPSVALASGKLLREDRKTLDSTGISMRRCRWTRDRGSEELDRGQYERVERVFGLSGAALMIRRSALDHLEVAGELFDEDFFAYHEDTDLAWRAGLLGWSCLYVPQARAAHRRGWAVRGWRGIDPAIRRHSFKNRYLEMIKNERLPSFLRDLPAILLWEGVRLGYALFRDPGRLPAYAEAWRLAGRALAKRRLIQGRRGLPRTFFTPAPLLPKMLPTPAREERPWRASPTS
jgi:GT2 family glycosyltransferase